MGFQLGMRRVEVEVNSEEIKEVIEKLNPQNKCHNPILREIVLFKQRPWELAYRITKREGNTYADWLAKTALASSKPNNNNLNANTISTHQGP
ncbi:hypothetical protein PIB30_060694 [Stylosanthes scabra]|uniref:RNase H type-1 domain-containing protein n=1 Tax=Stylosanthes scabra TaxID=79078 RepID=A0ABU6TKF7_9FABA|nr:hypothetical protein [Stylosanthes scabra]